MARVLLGLSGGVDSSVSALFLQQFQFDVVGVTLRFHELFSREDENRAASICKKLNIEHHIIDVSAEFASIVKKNFVDSYTNALTPNPCVLCNECVKFPSLIKAADAFNCEYIATGHYAIVTDDFQLCKATYKNKDQSYMLYRLPKSILKRCIFPLGTFSKEDIVKAAYDAGFNYEDISESQDICFLSSGQHYVDWLISEGCKNKPGHVIDINSKEILGTHAGLLNYTIGQRKGLNLGGGTDEPYYVVSKNAEKSELCVGKLKNTFRDECNVYDVHWTSIQKPTDNFECMVKIRYRSNAVLAYLSLNDEFIKVNFHSPVSGITPGQSAVFYHDDICLGGGFIA